MARNKQTAKIQDQAEVEPLEDAVTEEYPVPESDTDILEDTVNPEEPDVPVDTEQHPPEPTSIDEQSERIANELDSLLSDIDVLEDSVRRESLMSKASARDNFIEVLALMKRIVKLF